MHFPVPDMHTRFLEQNTVNKVGLLLQAIRETNQSVGQVTPRELGDSVSFQRRALDEMAILSVMECLALDLEEA
jgi:hypothetical protein